MGAGLGPEPNSPSIPMEAVMRQSVPNIQFHV